MDTSKQFHHRIQNNSFANIFSSVVLRTRKGVPVLPDNAYWRIKTRLSNFRFQLLSTSQIKVLKSTKLIPQTRTHVLHHWRLTNCRHTIPCSKYKNQSLAICIYSSAKAHLSRSCWIQTWRHAVPAPPKSRQSVNYHLTAWAFLLNEGGGGVWDDWYREPVNVWTSVQLRKPLSPVDRINRPNIGLH